MDFEEEQGLGHENVVQRHELLAAIQARILPGMSARRTARLAWSTPQRFTWRPSPSQLQNTTPSANPSRQAPTAPSTSSSSSSTLSNLSSSIHLPPELSPPWPWNPSETQLIRADYSPAYKPPPPTPAEPPSEPEASSSKKRARKSVMAEPRARAARHKGQMNFSSERKHTFPPRIPYQAN